MGAICDSVVLDSGRVELRMDIVDGEHENWDGKGPLKTRLDFYEKYPGCYKGRTPPAKREWFDNITQARARLRATIPSMVTKFLALCAEHGDDNGDGD